MEENDISNVISKFSDILKEKDIDINNIVNSNSNENKEHNSDSESDSNSGADSNNSGFNIDINTILKFKKITDKLNSNGKDSRSSLLQALRPFLSSQKQTKLDEYIKIVNILSILEALNGEL